MHLRPLSFSLLLITLSTVFNTSFAQTDDGWINLLHGDSLNQWHGVYDKKKKTNHTVGERWSIQNGVLHLDRSKTQKGEKHRRGGFLVTKKKYWNFELKFDFLISHNGNSGIKYRTDDTGVGPEFQLIDDVHYRDNKTPSHRTAGLYEIKGADEENKKLGVAGKDWNSARIIAKGNSLQHWINGALVMEIEYASEDWDQRFQKSKYARDYPHFATTPGSILLQDHHDNVSFRNLYLRELAGNPPQKASSGPKPVPNTKKKTQNKPLPPTPPAAFMNCAACHLLNDVQVGPSLVEIARIYPLTDQDYFVNWCINPGKKRPEMAQMPSMAHIPKKQLADIHTYILAVTEGLKPKKNHAKKDQFPDTTRPRTFRTFVPNSSPASVVVCTDTAGKHNLIWDSSLCRLRYISKGKVDNWPYLRSNGNSLAEVGKEIHSAAEVFSKNVRTRFDGYSLSRNNYPTFHYLLGDIPITETITIEANQITRTISSSGSLPPHILKSSETSSVKTNITHPTPSKLIITHILK